MTTVDSFQHDLAETLTFPGFWRLSMRYWKIGADEVGWIRLCNIRPVDARASANRLDIGGTGEFYFQISAPGLDADRIAASHWQLPGLEVQVEHSAIEARIERKPDLVEIHYHAGEVRPISCSLVTRLV